MNNIKKTALAVALLGSSAVQAAGFALIEQNASGMGNAYAGAAAVAEDASTIFFNPAGMAYIEGTQAVGALHLIKPNAKFKNEGSEAGAFRPLGDEGPNAGDIAFVPNFYYMTPVTPDVTFGLGVNAPFGLKTEYDDQWIGRFQAVKSELKTININPSLAFKINDRVSFGIGVSFMRAEAELTSLVNTGASEESADIEADGWGFGYNLGAIFQVTDSSRIGIAYRSRVKQDVDGDAKSSLTALNADPTRTLNTNIKASVTLPESFSVSAFSKVNSKWDLMGDVTWTRWSQFEELRVVRANGTGTTLSVTPENWENTLRYSVGATYHYNDAVKLRVGLAYDEEAIKDEFRTPRIPGNDRKWVSLGASYKMSPVSTFDIGYSHLFVSDVDIDDDQTGAAPLGKGRVRGKYEGSVDILSVQYTHNF